MLPIGELSALPFLINISRAPFYRLVKEGEIPIARHGTRTLVLAADVVRLLLKMRNEGLSFRPRRPGESRSWPPSGVPEKVEAA